MNAHTKLEFGPPVELAREADFVLGAMTVRPSASEVVADGNAQRVEPRVMQTLVALAQANEAVVSRDELLARCWSGTVVSEDALTRAVGQVRRLAGAPAAFSIDTIPKIGYRLVRTPSPAPLLATPDGNTPAHRRWSLAASLSLAAIVGLAAIAGAFAVGLSYSPPSPSNEAAAQLARLDTQNSAARDRYLRATALMSAGGRDNTLRAEQLLREALELDSSFHAAKETLVVALMAAATFVPERAGEANAEIDALLDDEIVETPLEWRAHIMRGFQYVFAGDWLAAERALTTAHKAAPEAETGALAALETFLLGNVGRVSESFDVVVRHAHAQPLSRDQSRVYQQWLNRLGRFPEAEAEYVRSRDLPGDRSAMELAALVRALGAHDSQRVAEQLARYRDTDWGRSGDDALSLVQADRNAALALLREQIEGWHDEGAMPPFLAAAWASYYGDHELAVKGLRAHPESLFAQAGLIWDPVFGETRRTASFAAFLRDFGYVEYWRTRNAWGDFCRPSGSDSFECR
jgi:DNA-binding winged helix-turn-helix (wHTH) protein